MNKISSLCLFTNSEPDNIDSSERCIPWSVSLICVEAEEKALEESTARSSWLGVVSSRWTMISATRHGEESERLPVLCFVCMNK